MNLDPTQASDRPFASDPMPNQSDTSRGEIELDDQAGLVRVRNPGLFQPQHRGFAQRLLESLCDHPGVKKAEIDLASSTCRIEFDLDSRTKAIMAEVLVDAIHIAPGRALRGDWWRGRPRWSTLTAYRGNRGVSVWETHEDQPGRVRLIHQDSASDPDSRARLARGIWNLGGVERYHISPWSQWITVVQGACDGPTTRHSLDRLEGLLQGTKLTEPPAVELGTHDARPVIVGWSRLGYLALAGGALVMTLVALAVPGIPTVPFLLATSYYLARSSPRLNTKLHRAMFIGPILEEWESHAALSLTSKRKLLGLTAVTVLVTLVVTPLSLITLILILVMSSLTTRGILGMPTIKEHAIAGSPSTLALAAP